MVLYKLLRHVWIFLSKTVNKTGTQRYVKIWPAQRPAYDIFKYKNLENSKLRFFERLANL